MKPPPELVMAYRNALLENGVPCDEDAISEEAISFYLLTGRLNGELSARIQVPSFLAGRTTQQIYNELLYTREEEMQHSIFLNADRVSSYHVVEEGDVFSITPLRMEMPVGVRRGWP